MPLIPSSATLSSSRNSVPDPLAVDPNAAFSVLRSTLYNEPANAVGPASAADAAQHAAIPKDFLFNINNLQTVHHKLN